MSVASLAHCRLEAIDSSEPDHFVWIQLRTRAPDDGILSHSNSIRGK